MIQRSVDDRVLLGVCGGLAASLGARPRLVRAAFILIALASGVGVVLYALLSLTMAPPGAARAPLSARLRENLRLYLDLGALIGVAARRAWHDWRARRASHDTLTQLRALLAAAALLAGLLILASTFNLFFWLTFWRATALTLILLGLALASPDHPPATDDDAEAAPPLFDEP